MPLINNQKALYQHALQNEYIMLASHICGLMSMKALVEAAEEENSPIIIQVGTGTREVFSPYPKFIKYLRDFCADYKAPVLLNHDHMQSVEDAMWAIDNGLPSIMFDGSHLPFEDNVAQTRRIVDYAHERGAWVEAELGNIPGFEDMVFSAKTVYTDPGKAAEFIDRTGCDSLAVAVGTAHGGVRAGKPLEIDFDLLGRLKKAVGATPLVLHGAASLPRPYIDEVNKYGGAAEPLDMCPETTIEKTRRHGVAKTNMDVDNMLVVTGAIRKHFAEHPEDYNHTRYLKVAAKALKGEIRRKMRDVTKSSGRGSSFKG